MLLSWNYTLELFFWIVVGAVALVSLTILLAKPKFRAKATELSENTLSLTGKNVDSYNQKKVSKKTNSSRIEEDSDFIEENKQDDDSREKVSFYAIIKAYCIIFLYSLFSFLISIFGVLTLYVEIDEVRLSNLVDELGSSLLTLCFGVGLFYSGLASLYGFLVNNKKIMKFNYRAIAILFFLSPVTDDNLVGLPFYAILPLIFSGDLKLLWLKITNYNEYKEELVSEQKDAFYSQIVYVLYSILLVLTSVWVLNYQEMLLTYFLGIPSFLCGFLRLYYFLTNDQKNIQFWNRLTVPTVLLCSIVMLRLNQDNIIGLGYFVSILIPLHFSGDLKIILSKIYGESGNDDIPLWWIGAWAVFALLIFFAVTIFV